MLARSRILTAVVAAVYLTAVSGSALFHEHDDHREQRTDCTHCCCDAAPGEDQHRTKVAVSEIDDNHVCVVCHFLAQSKSATPICYTPSNLTSLVQSVPLLGTPCLLLDVFSAWHSRAPPAA